MSAALTAPVVAAALLLCVSGAAKLRAPGPAARALAVAGLRVPESLVRLLSAGELGLGAACALTGGTIAAAALAIAYALFAVAALMFAHRRASCGCFGEENAPASALQAALSAGLAAVAAAGAAAPVHGLPWLLDRPVATAAVVALGVAGCVYAAVLAYTQLAIAWTAWSGR